ncbi:MAG: tRNA dihydrouridine(20/20a) synthase DusA [Gammaproteobacteria bacterium]|nr:tRNA dihydrouridine(20/20a) synthase DusA [Gammaproteobacteria bacterium]
MSRYAQQSANPEESLGFSARRYPPLAAAQKRLSVAPMMELTDRHFRHLMRLLTRHTILYTEMLTSKAVIHGDREYLLGMDEDESLTVLQLGGSDPEEMAEAAQVGEEWGYREININVGCPSDRVKSGRFGACLMAEPELVATCVDAMQSVVSIPVTVKCRLGIDRTDSFEALDHFVRVVSDAGCCDFTVHARKAWLDGLSPRENRTIPPLLYDRVYRLKTERPELHIGINGGIDQWDSLLNHLTYVDSVMIGRQAYYRPSFMARADRDVFGELEGGCDADDSVDMLARHARNYANYMQDWVEQGVRLSAMTRHLVALFQAVPGARQWRRYLSENASRSNNAVDLVDQALTFVERR